MALALRSRELNPANAVSGYSWILTGKTTEDTTKSLWKERRYRREDKTERHRKVRKRRERAMIYVGHSFLPLARFKNLCPLWKVSYNQWKSNELEIDFHASYVIKGRQEWRSSCKYTGFWVFRGLGFLFSLKANVKFSFSVKVLNGFLTGLLWLINYFHLH